MNSNKSDKGNIQNYEQVSQSDDKSEIIIFQNNKKISVSFESLFSIDKSFSVFFVDAGNRPGITNCSLFSLRTFKKENSCDVILKSSEKFFVQWMKSQKEIKDLPLS